jgi:hypothetical protein
MEREEERDERHDGVADEESPGDEELERPS